MSSNNLVYNSGLISIVQFSIQVCSGDLFQAKDNAALTATEWLLNYVQQLVITGHLHLEVPDFETGESVIVHFMHGSLGYRIRTTLREIIGVSH